MRVVFLAMLLMAVAPRAEACPHGTICVSPETRSQVRIAHAAIGDHADSANVRARTSVDASVRATSVRAETREIPRSRSMLQLAISRHESRVLTARTEFAAADRLTASLQTHRVARKSAVEMPWIWVQLRRGVYDRMPRYERIDRRPENRFSLVLSPVVVSSPQDTVPGVGVEGDF